MPLLPVKDTSPMTLSEQQRIRLDELRAQSRSLLTQRGAILDRATAEHRGLTTSEQASYDDLTAKRAASEEEVRSAVERVAELTDQERREGLAANSRVLTGQTGGQRSPGGAHVSGGETYHRGPSSPSFFKDLVYARSGDFNAAQRLARNNAETGFESRALGNTGGTGGSGGDFAPPGYLVDQFVALARSGRVTADLFTHADLPAGVSSIVIPKVLTGTAVGVQTTQNTAVANVDPTTSSLSSGITTTAGGVVVSRQLLDQSAVPFDEMILGDLAADHARQIGGQAITGTGASGSLTGYLTPASASVVPFTSASPTAVMLYQRLAQMQGLINSTRYKAPSAIIMHPRRWAHFASYVDANGRPLVSPTANGINSIATATDQQPAAGLVGNVLGVPTYVDANIPTNLGAGSDQDVVLMAPMDDLMLWESPIQAETFDQPFSGSMGIYFRIFNYSSLQPSRYLASLGQIQGTGLKTPVFAS